MIKKYLDIKLLIVSILSALIQSIAITSFSVPGNLYPGGFTGISRLASDIAIKFFNINFPYYFIYLALNIIVTLICYKHIGHKFTIYSVIQFSFVTFFTSFFKPLLVLDNEILYAIFGGLINGFGVGLALNFNFSSGGSDFLSVFFSNKFKKSIWNYVFIINAFVLLIAGLLFGWNRALYSIIFQYCSTEIIKILHKRYTYTTLTIITTKPKEVADEIQKNIRHGITEIHAHGHYSDTDNTMLYMVVNSFQYHNVISIVRNVDEHAFINVQNTAEVYGNYYQKPLD